MNQNQFIQAFEKHFLGLPSKTKIDKWLFIKEKQGFLFKQNAAEYLIKIGYNPKNHYPYFSISPNNESKKENFEYKMSHNDYHFEPKRGVILWNDDYKIGSFSLEDVIKEMRIKGWKENPIFEVKIIEIDFNSLILSILEWAEIRKKAIYSLRMNQEMDKKIKIEEAVSYTEEETPQYQKMLFPLNQILYGPSGTGKTYCSIAKAVAIADNLFYQKHQNEYIKLKNRYDELQEEGKIAFVTFHQNYSYEDFIQGIKPDISAKSLRFEKKDGIFKKLSNKALADSLQNYVLIIDEINRANISRVFGELITLIEADKRWGNAHQMKVILPSGETFCVPKNVYLIGTMNTADKSIALLDIALRRRFIFEYMPPKYENFTDEKGIVFLKSLNKEILAKKGKDFLIGHAAFMKEDFDWAALINLQIIPLLEEYFYTDKKGSTIKKMLEIAIDEASLEGEISKNEWDSLFFSVK